ncbi:MAG: 4-hydroxy-tetrahydrodipicolinate reductase [Alkalispirochaeta sp.]
MNIAIIGYGRMGHEIEAVALSRGHRVVARVDPSAEGADFADVDAAVAAGVLTDGVCAVDFALPQAVAGNVAGYARAGCSAVIGTTGWDADRDKVLAPAVEAGISLVWGSNFSVGANMTVRIAAFSARLADAAGSYDLGLVELHHTGKKDSPSGTAIMLAEEILAAVDAKRSIQTETLHRQIQPEELHTASARIGSIPGTHTLYLDSPADTVELTHRARNRGGFALGAVQAAEWIVQQRGVHPVSTFFDDLFQL